MMFGVALSLRPADFSRVIRTPVAPAAGLVAQFLLLPAATCAVTWLLRLEPEIALGMILIAACPGGNFSNIMTFMARGSVAVSVSMTAVSSVAAIVLTPLNFAFYGWLNPYTREYLTQISIDPGNILLLVVLVLGIPLVLGILTGQHWPKLADKSEKPLRVFSLVVLLAFAGIAFGMNFNTFLEEFQTFVWLVIGHNLLAFFLGFGMASLFKLPDADRRAVTMEVGIQNSGLGLVILFTFFPTAGGMLLIAGFWGVWHLIAGIALSQFWARRPPDETPQPVVGMS
ncbi:bile acid:sodium symporter family protein [Wenzhouxiangella sp. XN201]|nr:bile acid:sodium symporter family protein [Wenzhouxiangella sp. XN201]NEZ03577.1 bile acid:sodium symporter family protein [Wenzhouxiangella sp. XN201]